MLDGSGCGVTFGGLAQAVRTAIRWARVAPSVKVTMASRCPSAASNWAQPASAAVAATIVAAASRRRPRLRGRAATTSGSTRMMPAYGLRVPSTVSAGTTQPGGNVAGRIEDYAIVGDMQDGFLRWYEVPTGGTSAVDGLAGSEGAFLACSFWLANALELSGRHEEAIELFERLLALRNDVGLLSEEYDPRYGRLVGNMPQAFSHVPLVQTALNLEGHAEECRRGPWDERRSVPG